MRNLSLLAIALLAVTPAAANNASDNYTYGPLERTSQRLWINDGIPTGCRYTITNAGTNWTNAPANFSYVWSGYVTPVSWNWNGSDNISTTANTIDTVVQLGTTDFSNSLAQTEYRTRSYDPATDRYVFLDGDVVVNSAKVSGSVFWCSPSLPVPSNLWDFETMVLHELGHVLGLAHDPIDSSTVMWANQNGGAAKRSLTTRDSSRASYLYP